MPQLGVEVLLRRGDVRVQRRDMQRSILHVRGLRSERLCHAVAERDAKPDVRAVRRLRRVAQAMPNERTGLRLIPSFARRGADGAADTFADRIAHPRAIVGVVHSDDGGCVRRQHGVVRHLVLSDLPASGHVRLDVWVLSIPLGSADSAAELQSDTCAEPGTVGASDTLADCRTEPGAIAAADIAAFAGAFGDWVH